MELSEIQDRVAKIVEIMSDDEAAHVYEDALRTDFIRYIAKRKDHLGEKARLVLSTDDLEFGRFCA